MTILILFDFQYTRTPWIRVVNFAKENRRKLQKTSICDNEDIGKLLWLLDAAHGASAYYKSSKEVIKEVLRNRNKLIQDTTRMKQLNKDNELLMICQMPFEIEKLMYKYVYGSEPDRHVRMQEIASGTNPKKWEIFKE